MEVAVDKFLEDIDDKVSYLLDNNAEKERYDQIKKFENDIIEAQNKYQREIENYLEELEATQSKTDIVEVKRLNKRILILRDKFLEMLNKIKRRKGSWRNGWK